MQYRTLGKTGLKVSVVGIGTWQYGGEWGEEYSQNQVDAVMDAARDAGINLIDTAECYGDHLSESFVGKAIQKDREKWIVATKFGHHYTDYLTRDQLWTVKDVKKQLEESLKSLRTDHIDVYQFHSGDNIVFDNQELWTYLDKQKQSGAIGHLGISISNSHEGVLEYQSEKASVVGAEMLQLYYNRLDRRPESSAFEECRQQNLGVFARVPLASGFLSGKYKPGTVFPEGDLRSRRSQEQINSDLSEVQKIQKEEVPEGISMAAWALAWCLRDPVVTTVIPGCRNPEQVKANADASDLAGTLNFPG
ncbi:aldo/keto reductase [Oceanispirochaeta sp.]|jgi:myo-inositol catabolism protein IolS|uniref:aldo/keto reductase n=1 Tax=Oceanispirochaeta sp. TaxID=2035350 RepID=UPI00262DE304|nr:aldo/keto reductase [Oceanispirochaeta sp.]MDA3955185.1 aldo/keto reductase [Oceanispirochaeta sp.]